MKILCVVFCAVCLPAAALDRIDPALLRCTFKVMAEEYPGKNSIITSYGSAVCIALPGKLQCRYLLTAGHVVKARNRKVCVELADHWALCTTIKLDVERDLALLECEEELPAASQLTESATEPGGALLLIGCPAGASPSSYWGYLSDTRETLHCMAVPFYHGDSGAPVFDASKRLAGIAVAGIGANERGEMCQVICLFVPIDSIRSFLESVIREKK